MTHRIPPRAVAVCAAIACAAMLTARTAGAEVLERSARIGRVTLQYKVVLPAGYDPARTYPAVLVFGGGPQTMRTVDSTLERNFRAEAERRGYIVVAPAAPDGELFFEGGARVLPEFLRTILAEYHIEDGRFHVAGPSNGGIAALHVAAATPGLFRSATAFPGYLWRPTAVKLQALDGICVFMYVGEHDEYRWHDEMQREAESLSARGTIAKYTVEQGQGHRLETLVGASASRLFEGFEQARTSCHR